MENVNIANNKVLDEAAEWIARLRSDQVSAADQQAFTVWLSQDAAHRQAFDSVENLWQDLGVVRYLPHATAANEDIASPDDQKVRRDRSFPAFGRRTMTAAAALCVAVLLAWQLFPATTNDVNVIRTAVGEQKSIVLDDGSTVILNTDTKLVVRYSTTQRNVTLRSGEAYFVVAKDAKRPFVVSLDEVTVTAVGTAFNIRRQPQQALITVTEGEVKVADQRARQDAAQSENVRARQQIIVRDNKGVGAVTDSDVKRATAWQHQQLVFDGTRLNDVVAELNRYSSQQIKIADPLLNSLKVSGVFRLDDPQATLRGLETSLALEHVEQDGLILLYKKSL